LEFPFLVGLAGEDEAGVSDVQDLVWPGSGRRGSRPDRR
jgi:hypothetical protein